MKSALDLSFILLSLAFCWAACDCECCVALLFTLGDWQGHINDEPLWSFLTIYFVYNVVWLGNFGLWNKNSAKLLLTAAVACIGVSASDYQTSCIYHCVNVLPVSMIVSCQYRCLKFIPMNLERIFMYQQDFVKWPRNSASGSDLIYCAETSRGQFGHHSLDMIWEIRLSAVGTPYCSTLATCCFLL